MLADHGQEEETTPEEEKIPEAEETPEEEQKTPEKKRSTRSSSNKKRTRQTASPKEGEFSRFSFLFGVPVVLMIGFCVQVSHRMAKTTKIVAEAAGSVHAQPQSLLQQLHLPRLQASRRRQCLQMAKTALLESREIAGRLCSFGFVIQCFVAQDGHDYLGCATQTVWSIFYFLHMSRHFLDLGQLDVATCLITYL